MVQFVFAESSDDEALAQELARELDAELKQHFDLRQAAEDKIAIRIAEGIPHLCLCGPQAPGGVAVGFEGAALRHRRKSGQNELLGKAVGWKQSFAPRVLDVTAGYGLDSFLLADLGCEVIATERQPVLATLLVLARTRALCSDDEWLRNVASRMRFRHGDATKLDPEILADRDVIYLDPMFPVERRAAPGKGMQVLQRLCGESGADGEALLQWAVNQPVKRVVVKRPRKAPPLQEAGLGHKISGRAVRFDVYPINS